MLEPFAYIQCQRLGYRKIKHDLRGVEGELILQDISNIVQWSTLDHVQAFYLRLMMLPVFWHGWSGHVSVIDEEKLRTRLATASSSIIRQLEWLRPDQDGQQDVEREFLDLIVERVQRKEEVEARKVQAAAVNTLCAKCKRHLCSDGAQLPCDQSCGSQQGSCSLTVTALFHRPAKNGVSQVLPC